MKIFSRYDRVKKLFLSVTDELQMQAMTHSSYANDYHIQSNERLEYLGDAVLGLLVAEHLYTHCHSSEGKLSKMRAQLVCEKNLSIIASDLDISSRLSLGKSLKNMPISDAIMADAVEAMVGAIFVHHGYASIKSAVLKMLDIDNYISSGGKSNDYKSILQEYCQKEKKVLEYFSTQYTTKGGQINYRVVTKIDGKNMSNGKGSTKREAEQNSAKKVVEKYDIV